MSDTTVLLAMPSPKFLRALPSGLPLPGHPRRWALLVLLGLAGAQAPLPGRSQPLPNVGTCEAPRPGRYAVMGEGEINGEPIARLLLETWNPDGTLTGVRLERRGRAYRESAYTGQFRPLSNCRVAIERSYLNAVSTSQAVLDLQGRPRHSLGILPDVLMVSRWFAQPERACSSSLLDGVVVSQQQGRDWRDNRWQPNAVVQREAWQGGTVKGIAISSYGPTVEEATYGGTITVQPDCLATIQERDSRGVTYNYRAIVLGDGAGYLYLQTDPDDVSVAFLERVSGSAPPARGLW